MKKKIFSLLFFTHILSHGMFNKDLMPQITKELCINNNYNPLTIKHDIRTLSDTNTFFHHYYAQEDIKQNIIRLCSLYNNSNDRDTAHALGCHKIKDEIEYFINIAEGSALRFTKDDLKQSWYLNITTIATRGIEKGTQSLLYLALDHAYDAGPCNLKKIKSIIDNLPALNFQYGEHQNILSRIIFLRYFISTIISQKSPLLHDLLKIAQSLLHKGMLPDGHTERSQHTPLMLATMNKDRPFTRLLLQYNADPYAKTYCRMTGAPEQCAFDMNEGKKKQWLEKLVDEVKLAKNK